MNCVAKLYILFIYSKYFKNYCVNKHQCRYNHVPFDDNLRTT